MRLRKLEKKDAELMLEWMQDDNVVAQLGTNFKEKTIEDCMRFIEASYDDSYDLHRAIADEDDTYMGTVSLKHIDMVERTAEFAITVRSVAMGKGYSRYAMSKILQIGIDELKLQNIYWCVSKENTRAVRFYDKNGYGTVVDVPAGIKQHYSSEQLKSFLWYKVNGK